MTMIRLIRRLRFTLTAASVGLLLGAVAQGDEPFEASRRAAEFEKSVDWSNARLIAVQDAGRYKTLDSFARESISAMYGREEFPGISPLASLMEWLFNGDAYADTPLVRVKDVGLRIHFTAHMPEAQRQRIRDTGYLTPRELADPHVSAVIDELEPRFEMGTAIRRVRNAQAVAQSLHRFTRIVPRPGITDPKVLWATPNELVGNLPPEIRQQAGLGGRGPHVDFDPPVPGMTPDHAVAVLAPWAGLRAAWLRGDAAEVTRQLNRLADVLPTLAEPGVYPDHSQRAAEARYYAWGKFTWGYVIYFFGILISVWAMVTRWRTPWAISLVLLVAALGLHAYGLALRWYILGRIPIANMFEAIVAAAWAAVATGLIAELLTRQRVFALASHAVGFLALVLGAFVLPGQGTITTIMGILDDVMLRIHTVCITYSYALVCLAAVIAVAYLFGYYMLRHRFESAVVGMLVGAAGVCLLVVSALGFEAGAATPTGYTKATLVFQVSTGLSISMTLATLVLVWAGSSGMLIAGAVTLLCAALTTAVGDHGFVAGMGWTMLIGGLAWSVANAVGLLRQHSLVMQAAGGPALALAGAGGVPAGLTAVGRGGDGERWRASAARSGGGAAGAVENPEAGLPDWLKNIDWAHQIVLNMVFILLFVGTILGAVWADYSWGRPWGWDPKEVFALNTWIIYAILIHARFVVRQRGLWTAWLSVFGCVMMAFNWFVVNLFIVGLHSYA